MNTDTKNTLLEVYDIEKKIAKVGINYKNWRGFIQKKTKGGTINIYLKGNVQHLQGCADV